MWLRWSSDFLFLYNPHPLPHPDKPPGRPTPKDLDFGPFGSVRSFSAPFGSVWVRFGSVSGPFRVRFGVLGGVGVGSGGGVSVREKNITALEPKLVPTRSFFVHILGGGIRVGGEAGAICQIGALTRKWCCFGPKNSLVGRL